MLLVPFVLVIALWPLLIPRPDVGDTFLFWAVGHMVVTGQSPYDLRSWEAAAAYGPYPGGVAANTTTINLGATSSVWAYPPQTAYLFAPFGALPYEVGVPMLHVFILICGLLGIAAGVLVAGLRGPRLVFALTIAVISQPFVISVRYGHPIGLLVVGAVLVYLGVARRRDGPALLGMALLTLKPHLTAPLALGAVAYVVWRRDWRRLGAMAAGAALVTLPFELATPFPFESLIASSGERLGGDVSTLSALARDLGAGLPLAVALGMLTAAACILAFLWAPSELRPRVALASALAGSLAFIPYSHDYDTLLVVPVAFVALALGIGTRAETAVALVSGTALVFVPWLLFFWWSLAGEPQRALLSGPLGAVPVVLALALAAAASTRVLGVPLGATAPRAGRR
jgi:hypothetical protein